MSFDQINIDVERFFERVFRELMSVFTSDGNFQFPHLKQTSERVFQRFFRNILSVFFSDFNARKNAQSLVKWSLKKRSSALLRILDRGRFDQINEF